MHKLMIDEVNKTLNTDLTEEDVNSILAFKIEEESIELISKYFNNSDNNCNS